MKRIPLLLLALAAGLSLLTLAYAAQNGPAAPKGNDPYEWKRKAPAPSGTGVSEFEREGSWDELDETLTIWFFDALTGNPIEGGNVEFMGQTSLTQTDGGARFPWPKLKDQDAKVPMTFSKKNYITTTVPLHFMSGALFLNHYSISPSLAPGRYRFVLDWGKSPDDLDIHLVKVGRYHISYRDSSRYEEMAWLDRDDQNGQGPETITVSFLEPEAHYILFIHDYTNRSEKGFKKFGKSSAHIMIYNDSGLYQSFETPTSGTGRYWKVCEINNRELVLNGEITDTLPAN